MATKKAFKPLLVYYDEREHMKAEDSAQKKLTLLDDASVWIHNQLDLEDAKINPKRLHLNMIECFKDVVLHHFKDVNQLGLSANKLIEAKEIPLIELKRIQENYEAIELHSDIKFENNVPMIEITRKDFEIWTTSEKQNQKVILGNQFIKSIKDLVAIGIKVFPNNIIQGTSSFIIYDIAKNNYALNREYIFS